VSVPSHERQLDRDGSALGPSTQAQSTRQGHAEATRIQPDRVAKRMRRADLPLPFDRDALLKTATSPWKRMLASSILSAAQANALQPDPFTGRCAWEPVGPASHLPAIEVRPKPTRAGSGGKRGM
jgi:hypothetical protein